MCSELVTKDLILRILFGVFLGLSFCISAELGYILGNSKNTLIPKSQEFVNILAQEVFDKTGVRIYIDVIDQVSIPSAYPTKQSRQDYQQKVLQTINTPYVVIFLFLQEHKIELESSEDLQSFLGQKVLDSIYFDYMAPLLPLKESDLTPQRISSVLLNGYSEIADRIARHYNIKLEHNFKTDEQGVRNFVRFVMYAMLLILIVLFALAYIPRKQGNK